MSRLASSLLLSAGLGTRLRPITNTIPKCMLSIDSRPLLAKWIDDIYHFNEQRIVINTHHLAHVVEDYFSSLQSEFPKVELVYEEQLLGTAGTLLAQLERLGNGDTLVAHADNFCMADFGLFIEAHLRRPRHALITMMTFETNRSPEQIGLVETNDSGMLVRIHEKQKIFTGNVANGAIYIFSEEAKERLRTLPFLKKNLEIVDHVLPYFLTEIYCYPCDGELIDIGTKETYFDAQQKFSNKKI